MSDSHTRVDAAADGDARSGLDLLGLMTGPSAETGSMPDGLSIEWLMDRLTKPGDDA